MAISASWRPPHCQFLVPKDRGAPAIKTHTLHQDADEDPSQVERDDAAQGDVPPSASHGDPLVSAAASHDLQAQRVTTSGDRTG
jgi:hypothetical protein